MSYELKSLFSPSPADVRDILKAQRLPCRGARISLIRRLKEKNLVRVPKFDTSSFFFQPINNNSTIVPKALWSSSETKSSSPAKKSNDFHGSSLVGLTNSIISSGASPRSFSKADEVQITVTSQNFDARTGNHVLTGEAEGSSIYRVTASFNPSTRQTSGSCTCPDRRGGYCKHVCALLLTAV
eukprot:c25884_g1_i1.p1 GENE.c25884_g1_i1~~c25884_g1_i1.p1  ORF type:complete len:183 (+),score=63.49 c25884_g1_i1:53-601(+)